MAKLLFFGLSLMIFTQSSMALFEDDYYEKTYQALLLKTKVEREVGEGYREYISRQIAPLADMNEDFQYDGVFFNEASKEKSDVLRAGLQRINDAVDLVIDKASRSRNVKDLKIAVSREIEVLVRSMIPSKPKLTAARDFAENFISTIKKGKGSPALSTHNWDYLVDTSFDFDLVHPLLFSVVVDDFKFLAVYAEYKKLGYNFDWFKNKLLATKFKTVSYSKMAAAIKKPQTIHEGVSFLVVTHRPDDLSLIFKNFGRQQGIKKELVLVLNKGDYLVEHVQERIDAYLKRAP